MENYVFVCIGTNQLIEDSFGPRVGDILTNNFDKYKNIEVLGTTKSPIHFQNAPIFLDYLKTEKGRLILIDSAIGMPGKVGDTYISIGGLEIGKAFGKSLYFPADISIKTVVETKDRIIKLRHKKSNEQRVKFINKLAQELADKICNEIYEIV